MKKNIYVFIVLLFPLALVAQQMRVKNHNFQSFRQDEKIISEESIKRSSPEAQQHPEFGILPFNAQCVTCAELIDERTVDSRQFINPDKPNHTFSQKSFLPLHYKRSENDIWRTIDKRLRPTSQQGVYTAENQPVPTKFDVNKKSTSLRVDEFEFEFNREPVMYFYNENDAYTKPEPGKYDRYTVGEEGAQVKDIWQGVNLELIFTTGEIKANYVIPAPLSLPISKGWMVIEDHFTLPVGYAIIESPDGERLNGGEYFKGNYTITNPAGEALITYEKPVFIDAKAWGMHGKYKLLREPNNEFTLQMFIPIDWLNDKENLYPLTIDPVVSGITKLGSFRSTAGGITANMGFSTKPAFCEYKMFNSPPTSQPVVVPGKSKLTNVFVDLEYQLTYDNTCGVPPLTAPFCTFSQVTMEVLSDTCKTTTGLLSCNPAAPPYTGTCTTDSILVPSARSIRVNSLVPNYLGCLQPQCPDYELNFTLRNQDSICGDACGYLCARGNLWQMTVEACKVEGNITQDRTQVCAGQPVIFTAHPNCGVPPYRYEWKYDTVVTTISNSPDITAYPEKSIAAICTIYDACNEFWVTNSLDVTVVPAPPADAGGPFSLCEGGLITLGGNPTSNGSTILWTGSDPTVQSYMNSTSAANPLVTVPAGTVDTFFYVVKATDANCFRQDTAYVYSGANPTPNIDSSGPTSLCTGQSVDLFVTGSYASYKWSNGATTPSIRVSQPGQYSVQVTDANGCTGTSNAITVSITQIPNLSVYPDTTILYGDSVMLYTDINLASGSVDSFTWYPAINISCQNCTTPWVSPLSDQYYGLKIYIGGCMGSDSSLIRIIYPNNFFIPNAFTPNNDGNNDNFYIQTQSGVEVVSFQIFNRFGEKVHDGKFPWDGNYRGKPAPPEVYTYIAKLNLFGNDRAVFRKGSVMLIR
ncbi:MAG: gliding motility-associated C-terminal domain-containing protein [Bacteroidetes bacterium]|nr:gliding motility-associated C-terminal domain-containing protein [Bacteroidota bacterium]